MSSTNGNMPGNVELERQVIGALLLDNEAIDRVIQILTPGDFYSEKNGTLYETICALWESGSKIDVLLISEAMHGKCDVPYVGKIIAEVATTSNVKAHARAIKNLSILRQMLVWSANMGEQCKRRELETEQIVKLVEEQMGCIQAQRNTTTEASVKELMHDHLGEVDRLCLGEKEYVKSGFVDIDTIMGGFVPGTMTVLAGRPSMGKSSLATIIARNAAAKQGKSVFISSLEMRQFDIVARMVCELEGIDSSVMRNGKLLKEDLARYIAGAGRLAILPISIDTCPSPTISDLRSRYRIAVKTRKVDLIVIDYLQLIRTTTFRKTDTRQNEIASISGQLKAMAVELDVPILVLSQLNRAVEGRDDHVPRISDLRESGAVEQDADVVLLLHRPAFYDAREDQSLAELRVAKNRNGMTGSVRMNFEARYTRFTSRADVPEREVVW